MLSKEEQERLKLIRLTDTEKILFRHICEYSIDGEDLKKLVLKQWFNNWYEDELKQFCKECCKYSHIKKKCTILDFPIVYVFRFLIFKLLS